MPSWYEDESFWEQFYPAVFAESRWQAAETEARSAATLLGVLPPATVLDMCCGPGRHAVVLAKMGLQVTGVDRTHALLERAREHARDAGVSVSFVQEDARRFRQAGQFDAAVSLFTSFGYFEDPTDDRTLLENVHASLRPGGKFLMDLSGKEVLARSFQERYWWEPEAGLVMLEERTLQPGWERVLNRWILIRDTERHEARFSIRLYSGVELRALMLAAGFSAVTLYGDFDGGPYDNRARRLVALAEK